ncbi:tetratricopeptide repeat protein [candidate division KSB1 bacterium]|nr:tetratricopeptide repeat protein [candidate division KSB1 bacterium]MBL7092541.1 tetratricopeptide repeat protein [candidate division KSB1 bacterium]
MNSIKVFYVFFLLILGLFFIVSCGTMRPEIDTEEGFMDEVEGQNQSEIDELFGIINESEQQQDESSGDDEVLQLLGIEKQQPEQAGVQETSHGQQDDQLQGEIQRLEQELSNKEAEITDLKSDVMAKDEEIGILETSSTTAPEPSQGNADMTGNYREDYQLALQSYYNRNYKTAIQMFDELLAVNSSHSLSDNCRYWIGESYYGLGNYNQAIIEFTKVSSFSKSNKMDDAQLKLGLCFWRLGDSERAAQEFERLISDYPESEYIEKAQQFLAKIQ